MYTTEVVYQGELRTKATHLQSKNFILTDAPIDNNGKGAYFSPTDLVAAALGSCMLTIMGIEANKLMVNINNSTINILKIMGSNPRRIIEFKINIEIKNNTFSNEIKAKLEYAAINCPVAKSINPNINQIINISYS